MTRVNNSLRMKETNKLRILDLIRKQDLSRADIARETGLSRAAVTLIVDCLINDGLVTEGALVKSGSGRRPTMLGLVPTAYVTVGIDISRDGCNIIFCDFTSRPFFRRHIELCDCAEQTVDAICKVVRDNISTERVLGVGVCCPGPLDAENGIILNPPGLDLFSNFNIKRAIEQKLSFPTVLQKDTNALAIAEKNVSGADGDILFLLGDHGLGCGLIKDGKIFSGYGGMGCEIGHITVKFDGEMCRCGNVGCAELYASVPATLNRAQKVFAHCPDMKTLVSFANNNDADALRLLRECGEMLSVACINAVNIFEPDHIVLGGELGEATFILKDVIEQRLDTCCLSRGRHKVSVVRSALDNDSRAFAASEIVLENFFGEDI